MSNVHNLNGVVLEMTSYLYHVTKSEHENKETIKTNHPYFCEENVIDKSFSVFEILIGGMATRPK